MTDLTMVTADCSESAVELQRIMRARNRAFSLQEHCSITIPCGLKYGGTPEYELAYLAHVAYSCGSAYAASDVIVEIGSLVGKSTIAMASVATNPIVAIDPHDGPWEITISQGDTHLDKREEMGNTLGQFTNNLIYFGVEDKVEVIQEYSDVAAKNWDGRRICLLFIDGDHTEKWVDHDLYAFLPYMAPGGLIAFHDYSKSFVGVKAVVDKAFANGTLRKERLVGSLMMTMTQVLA
jgi:predicted O-methyltransferase YrrM